MRDCDEQMESLFDELCKNMEDILAVGHLGLVTCLAETCQRLRLKQDELIVVRNFPQTILG